MTSRPKKIVIFISHAVRTSKSHDSNSDDREDCDDNDGDMCSTFLFDTCRALTCEIINKLKYIFLLFQDSVMLKLGLSV